jgi:hypothetical protein
VAEVLLGIERVIELIEMLVEPCVSLRDIFTTLEKNELIEAGSYKGTPEPETGASNALLADTSTKIVLDVVGLAGEIVTEFIVELELSLLLNVLLIVVE